MSTPEHHHCLIVGSGPAGYTAAIYAARADMKPVLYQGQQPGGQLTETTEVDNFPGYPAGINGPQMMKDLEDQAKRFDTDVRYGWVTKVDFSGPVHKVWVGDNQETEIHADTVIISTGASAKWLGLESELRLRDLGGGVSACAVCDGALPRFREVPLAVVGGGDSAVEEATYLANLDGAKKVYLIHRRDELRASKIMADRAKEHPNIEIVWNSVVDEVLGNDEKGVTGLKLKNTLDDSTSELEVNGMFAAIGHTPNTSFLQGKLEMNGQGYITWTKPFRTNTSVEGVFAAGDVADDYYRQAITSAGTGCMSALDCERYLVDKGI